MTGLEQRIQAKAYALGFEKCGIVPIGDMEDYGDRLEERMQNVPGSAAFYERFRRYTKLAEQYPWAKSVVVAVFSKGKYHIPEHLQGHIGKHYIFDSRTAEDSEEFIGNTTMEAYLREQGLTVAAERKFGLVGLRWAAMKAGLGIIRRNNFFYTESGSWVSLAAWITDGEIELKEISGVPACPEGCRRCMDACPTGSLSAPFTMSPFSCVSLLTTNSGEQMPFEPYSKKFGGWIYGCDACQDACPMNKGKWQGTSEFPGVAELAPHLTPEAILEMEDGFYRQNIQPKFFYLSPDELWKWKVNVLNFMRNNYHVSYKPYIAAACDNENDKVREMARRISGELCL